MNLKNLPYSFVSLLLIFTLAACSDNDNNEPEPAPPPVLKITSDKSVIVPFEKLTINISPDIEELFDKYDSIKWEANGFYWDGFIIIGGGDTNDPYEFEFTDYEIGKHKIYINGYINDEIVEQDFIEYEVIKPSGDFFNFEWNKITENKHTSHSYLTLPKHTMDGKSDIYTQIRLGLSHTVENGNEHAVLRFTPHRTTFNRALPDIESIDWFDDTYEGYTARAALEYKFLHEYITSLYGSPLLSYSGDDVTQTNLIDEYNARFNYKPDSSSAYPIEIWTTSTTSICLLQYNSTWGGVNTKAICMVVAEPRK